MSVKMRTIAAVALASVVLWGEPGAGHASDHQDGPQLSDDFIESSDITDFHVFPAPNDDSRLVLGMNVDHRAKRGARLSDAVTYRFRLRPADVTGTGPDELWVSAGADEVTVACTYAPDPDAVTCRAYPSDNPPQDDTCEAPCLSSTTKWGESSGNEDSPMRVFVDRVPDSFFEDFLLVREPRLRHSDAVFGVGLNTFKFFEVIGLVVEIDVEQVLGDRGPRFAAVAETVMIREQN